MESEQKLGPAESAEKGGSRVLKFIRVFFYPDGGAGAGAGAGGGEGAGGETGQAAAVQTGEAAQAAEQVEQAAADPRERAKSYREMIRGEYKDLYDADVQRIVQSRLKSAKGAEENLGKIESALNVLKQAYGVEDLDQLNTAITQDNRFYEEEAMKRGMDVDTYRELKQKDEALARYRAEQEAAREREEQTRQVMGWRQEEAKLKETFPDFDLETEIDASNGELFQMLKRGIPLEHAYYALHMDEIVGNSLQGAMQRGAQKALETVRANGMRPGENGNGNGQAVPRTVDVSKITPAQMREIEKRLMRGEEITANNL